MFSSLRVRLTLWYVGIFGCVMLVFAFAAYAFLERSLYKSVEDGARIAAKNVATSVKLSSGRPYVDMAIFEDTDGDATNYEGVAGVLITDLGGRVLAHDGAALQPYGLSAPEDQTIQEMGARLWVHSQAIVLQGHPIGVIRIARPLVDLDRTLRGFAAMLGLLVPIALIITLLAGIVMAGKVMEPIQEAFDRLRRFTADASHELRTPLAIIQAQTDAIAGALPESPDAMHSALEPIRAAARRMNSLVGDLLFLARSDGSAVELAIARLDLDELVEATVEEYAPLARQKGLDISYAGDPIQVHGDPQRLHQLVANLLGNAIKYTDAGGVHVTVQVQGASAIVRVSDTGAGIDAAHLPHIFKRFYRTDEARSAQKPGTGLGLSIALAIAYAHRGDIRVQSELGKGTQFTVSLPAT